MATRQVPAILAMHQDDDISFAIYNSSFIISISTEGMLSDALPRLSVLWDSDREMYFGERHGLYEIAQVGYCKWLTLQTRDRVVLST